MTYICWKDRHEIVQWIKENEPKGEICPVQIFWELTNKMMQSISGWKKAEFITL